MAKIITATTRDGQPAEKVMARYQPVVENMTKMGWSKKRIIAFFANKHFENPDEEKYEEEG